MRELTIACTLGEQDHARVSAAWTELFRGSLLVREEVPGGIRLAFAPGAEAALAQLIEVERECCAWAGFELEGPVVTITAPGPGEDAVRAMWRGESEATEAASRTSRSRTHSLPPGASAASSPTTAPGSDPGPAK